jgi:ribosomal protein S18 acetylase RimI-like enzyme
VDDADLARRQLASQTTFFRALTLGTPGSSLSEQPGLMAFVMPTAPDAAFVNSVVYSDPDAVAPALDGLAEMYAAAGVRAWTVWVRPGDRALAGVLGAAGHALDTATALMAATLDELELVPRGSLDLDHDAPWATLGRVNDLAYGLPYRSFEVALTGADLPSLSRYVARVDGEAAACVVASWHEGDCGIYLVATDPRAQGAGLCSELLRLALREAREAGCETTSLEATTKGRPVYERIGYRALGTLEMWEHRVPRPPS